MDSVSTPPVSDLVPATKAGGANSAAIPVALFIAFVAAHVPLAILMREVHFVATLHAISCLVIGCVLALLPRRDRALSALAYIAGSEVLWRMNHAAVFWEFAKYATIAIGFVAIVRSRPVRNRRVAFAYIAFLLPSIAVTVSSLSFDRARDDIILTLSGPTAIAFAIGLGSGVRLTPRQLVRTFVAFLGPALGIAWLAFHSTVSHANLEFEDAANFITSAGYGPNQVAAELALGALLALLLVIDRRFPWRLRIPMFGLAFALVVMATLTFARGGLVLTIAGALAAMYVALRHSRRARATIIIVGALTFVIGRYLIEPQLEQVTGGALAERYTTLKTSGRLDLAESELALFAEHPVLGVGPGVGIDIRYEAGWGLASHTEYSRMLAEHGVFGVFSLVCLVILGARAIRYARDTQARAIAAALIVWVALFLLIYATRVVAPAFAFGLAFATSPPAPKVRT